MNEPLPAENGDHSMEQWFPCAEIDNEVLIVLGEVPWGIWEEDQGVEDPDLRWPWDAKT